MSVLNRLRPAVSGLRHSNPKLFYSIVGIARKFFGRTFGVYPRVAGKEIRAVASVLRSSQWNMTYGRGLAHERLEADFAEFTGASNAVAVGSGGVAIQMSLRALGILPGDEVLHQVDTCSATAMAVMNAGATPIFADIESNSLMLDMNDVRRRIGPSTKAIIGTHMWGNPEAMRNLSGIAQENGLLLIEDACLGLGTVAQGRAAGSWGHVGVFSFGCIKPIQTGEGGMITTSDDALARELRSLRHWGDRTIDYGVRDATTLAWNGRMSEILAAVAVEQLKGYPTHLRTMREAALSLQLDLGRWPGLSLALGTATSLEDATFTQLVIKLDKDHCPVSKSELMTELASRGVPAWHANFELIPSLSFFRKGGWRKWILRGDTGRLAENYADAFPTARAVFETSGLGLVKINFLSKANRKHLRESLDAIFKEYGH